MPSSLCVLGNANMDLVVTAASAVEAGGTVFGTSFALSPGGKGLNQAVAAARAGGAVCFIGTVGIDEFGSRIVGMLEEEGIDITRVARVARSRGVTTVLTPAPVTEGAARLVELSGG